MTGGPAADCHCAQYGLAVRELGPLPPARLPGWATPIRAPPNLDQHCPAVRSGLRPTVTVFNVDQHCPAVRSGPAANWYCAQCALPCCSGPAASWYCAPCGPALPHDRELGPLLRTHLPGWATPIRAPPNLDQYCPALRSGLRPTVTVLNVDQHCPMTGSLVHCHLCAWVTPIRAPQIWTSTARLIESRH